MDRKELKSMAKQQITGNIAMYFLASLIAGALISLSGIIVLGPVIISPLLVMGLVYISLDIRNGNGVKLGRIFTAFEDFGRTWCTFFLSELFTFLWTLLFIIPGIIKSLSYSMAPYIIAENPDISASDAIKKSMRMMEGHKGELFVLRLSFIGWILLGLITFGLVYIYVDPYMSLSEVNFYYKIKSEPYND